MQNIYDRIVDYRLASSYLDVTRVPHFKLAFRYLRRHHDEMQSLTLQPYTMQPRTNSVAGSRSVSRPLIQYFVRSYVNTRGKSSCNLIISFRQG